MKITIILLAFTVSYLAAQTKAGKKTKDHPTIQPGVHIGKHQMGELFQQWLTISGIDLVTACPPHANAPDYYLQPYRMYPAVEDRPALCLQLMPVQNSGVGTFDEDLAFDGPDPFIKNWTFAGGKLSMYSVVYKNSDMQQHVGFLTEAYGRSPLQSFVAYQNGYGATWKRLEIDWKTSDGGHIYLSESSKFDEPGHFTVIFISGDAIRRKAVEVEKETTNPYGH